MTPEEAAVAARLRKERDEKMLLYGGSAAAVVGMGAVVFWCLGAAEAQGRRQAQLQRRMSLHGDSQPFNSLPG